MVLLRHKFTHSHIHVFFLRTHICTYAYNECALAGILIDNKSSSCLSTTMYVGSTTGNCNNNSILSTKSINSDYGIYAMAILQ